MGSYLNYEQYVLFLMFFKNRNITFIFIIVIRTILVVSSSSWINAWLSLEVNIISIIPILITKQDYRSTSSSIKYFLIQAIASIVLIIMILISYSYMIANFLNINNEIILIGLAMKSGIPPFHFWLPQVIEIVDFIQIFIIMSWQKIAPFSLISFSVSNIIVLLIITSAVIGAVGGYNQNSIKKIIVYSSITHRAWMIMAIVVKAGLWLTYFIIYSIRIIIVCILINKISLRNIADLTNIMADKNNKFFFMTNLLSISGLPPFIGFAAKFLVLKSAVASSILSTVTMLLMMSFISVFYYLKVSFSAFIITENKIFKKIVVKISSWTLFAIFTANILIPAMVYLS